MCQRLNELRQALQCYATRFDAAVLSAADARTALGHAAAIEHLAVTIKALASARIAETGSGPADRSAAHEVARVTGTSVGAARQTLVIGRRLAEQPEVSAAARRGALSPLQLAAITDAAEADPAAGQRLVQRATARSLSELRDDCARAKAAARCDAETRRQHIRRNRRIHRWTDTDGVWHIRGQGNPEDGAQVDAALDALADGIFQHARRTQEHEPTAAYAFDALVRLAIDALSPTGISNSDSDPATAISRDDLACPGNGPASILATNERDLDGPAGPLSPTSARGNRAAMAPSRQRRGAPVKLLLRVDYDAWLRGAAGPGETCELVGYGPVAVSVVRDLIDIGDAFVGAILTRTHAVAGVAHLGRRPNAYQQSALEWLYPSCAAEGCPAQAHLQTDHRVDWATTHFTALDLLDRLCVHHHNLKTRDNWQLIDGHGKRPFVSPDDPRHPRNRPPPPSPP